MADSTVAPTPAPGTLLKAQLQVQLCVMLWGFTAILGRLISLSAFSLVLWRLAMVVAVLALLPRCWRALRALPVKMRWTYAGIGAVVTLHWLTFYGAIKLADASIAATCLAIAPAFLSLIEPLLTDRSFNPRELLLGIAVVPGVALVVGGVPSDMRWGLAVGILSAFFVAIFGALNKRFVHHAEPMLVTALELGAGAVLLAIVAVIGELFGFNAALGWSWQLPSMHDALLLLVLAGFCTILPFSLFLVALRHVSSFSAQLAVNLEPVYAVLLAIPLLGEQRELSASFYLGMLIILAGVFLQPALLHRRSQH